ncbi:MAG: ATP-binding cassette domain-containing protein, partial [Streptosporangiaceae bacterium]
MKPIRYGQWKRWTDAFQGWRDGRGGIPGKLTAGAAPGPVTTPHREALIRQAQDAFGYEHLAYSSLVAGPHRQIMADRARLEAARSALAWAVLGLDTDSRALTAAETTRRRLGEDHHPETVIVQRRLQDHHKLLDRTRAAVTRAQADIAEIETDLAQVMQEAQQHHQVAIVRVERIHEHIHRRLAVYRRALIRGHPDGAWANAVLSVRAPEIPGWALPDAYGPESVPLPSVVPEVTPEAPEPPAGPAATTITLRHPVTRFGSGRPADADPGAEQGEIDENTGYVILDTPVAAPWHFTIRKAGGQLELRTRGHEHGPYMGEAVAGAATLGPGDSFDFDVYRYTMRGENQLERVPLGECDLVAAGLFAVSGEKPRLTGMSFVQRENTLLAILGPSGAGKSSLFGALLAELPLESGRLFFRQMSMATQSGQIRKRLGFVPQQTNDLHPCLSVAATLRYGFGLRSPAGQGSRAGAIEHALKVVELDGQRDQMLSTLSGGQLRRISIALELLTNPPLLMLDEPTSGLDANMDRQIMTFLRTHAQDGHTVIVVTHATEHLSMADQVLVVVQDGAPAYSGPPRQIRRHFKFGSYADLMDMLLKEPRVWAERYRTGRMAKEAMAEADFLQQRPPAELGHRDGWPHGAGGRVPRAALRKFTVLLRRQCLLMLCRGLTKNA